MIMNVPILTNDDYYRYNAPFRQWLFDFKGKQLGDFKTEDARKIFTTEFVISWNNSKLSREYYLNGPNMKTNFVINKEKEVSIKIKKENFGFTKQEASRLFSHSLPKTEAKITSTSTTFTNFPADLSHIKRRAEDLEELAPKKEGHAKIVENRRLKSSYTRLEKNNPHDIELSDESIFSGSISSKNKTDPNYHQLIQQERERAARKERERLGRNKEKEDELKEKMEKYNRRESEVNEILKKMINKKSN